jgi:hypothetical protein
MVLSMLELANARESVRDLLDRLQLEAYLFEVEPRDSHWEVRIECGTNDEWESVVLEVDAEQLKACREPGRAREDLLTAWGGHLGACARNGYESD